MKSYRVMKENLILALVWVLPRSLIKWCAIRLLAHATTGEYSDTNVPELSVMDALNRW